MFTNVAWLRELDAEPLLEINPVDAKPRGIKDGDLVRVFNDRGEVKLKAKLHQGIRPGLINIFQGWWPGDFIEGTHQALTHDTSNPAQQAIDDGAIEVDMVINIGALKGREFELVERDIAMVARTSHNGRALCKVIIEAALLTEQEKVKACELARKAGVDYVKTSTGFGPGGATVADVALMRRVVGSTMGVKAAGGIGTFADAKGMVAAGATRIGASAGIKIVQEAEKRL